MERSPDAAGGTLAPPLCDRGRGDRGLFPAVSLAQGSSATRGSSSVCGESRPLRLVAFPSSGRGGAGLCGGRRGVPWGPPLLGPGRGGGGRRDRGEWGVWGWAGRGRVVVSCVRARRRER